MFFMKHRNRARTLRAHRGISSDFGIEALEPRRLLTAILVTTVSDSPSHTGVSLRDAIATANTDAAAGTSDTITFASSVINQTITLTQGQLELGEGGAGSGLITIDGNSVLSDSDPSEFTSVTVDGTGASSVFYVDPGVHADVTNLVISGGDASFGGGIVNEGTLAVTSCSFQANDATNGGAILNAATLTVTGCAFGQNVAGGTGGAIENQGTLTVTECNFTANATNSTTNAAGGGAIDNDAGMATVTDSTFSGDSASNSGGGINNNDDGTLTVTSCQFSEEAANYGNGGAIYIDSGTVTLSGSTLSANSANNGGGGGITNNEGTLTVANSTFSDDTAAVSSGGEGDGGGIYNEGNLTVANSTFSDDSTGGPGGGISNAGTLTVANSTFSDDSATDGGGGIFNTLSGTLTVANSTFSNDSGGLGVGGGIYSYIGTLTVANSTFSDDSAAGGGGIANNSASLTVTNSTVSGNSATGYGGGIDSYGSSTLLNTIVAGNTAGSEAEGPDVDGQLIGNSTYDLIGDGTGMTGISNGTQGNLVGTSAAPIDPELFPLYYNGGDTQTMALSPGSRAIGAGGPITTLTSEVGTLQTTLSVANAAAIASTPGNYVIQIDDEQMLVTSVDLADNTVSFVPAYNGTPFEDHPAGASVFLATDQIGQPRGSAPDIGAFQDQPLYSTVAPLPATENNANFLVTWSAHPAAYEPPVASYTIYVSDNGDGYTDWQYATAATAAIFPGVNGHTYSFYSVATDVAGNIQTTPTAAQATTMTAALAAPVITSAAKATFPVGASGSFTVTASGVPTPYFSETGTLPSGVTFNTLSGVLSGTAASGNAGTYNLTFGAFNGVGTAATQSFTLTVAKGATTTKLTKNTSAPIIYGQSVTFTAAVAASGANAITPSGTVSFMDGTTTLGTATLSGGIAKFTTTTLGGGSHSSIKAVYAGDANFTTSTSGTLTQTVNKSASAATLTKNTTAPITYGQSVTFTATLIAVSPGAGIPTGTVTFEDGSTVLGTSTLSGSLAKFTTATLPVGSNSIKAVYAGDANFTTSTSNALSQTVNKSASTTKLTENTSVSVKFGQSVTLTATLAAVSPGAGTPTGIVTFFDNGSSIGAGTLSGGIATFTTTTLPVGSNSITAVYGGDTNFTTSTTSALTQTVNQSSTTTKLTKNTTTAITSGQSVTFTATLAAVSPGAGTPTGTVDFMDNGSSLGIITLSGGIAMLTTTTLPVGSNSITAVYSGDTDFTTSTSGTVTQTVNS